MTTPDRDNLYATPLGSIAGFRFDERVVPVFQDMIQRSVPGYEAIVKISGELAGRYAQPGSQCYDLGCSLGASTLAMRQHIEVPGCEIIGIDNSPAMIERCHAALARESSSVPVTLRCEDIEATELCNASVVVMNFTLQFIPPAQRDALITRIFQALRPGGALLLAEKVCFEDPAHQALMTELHHNFKRANGYSELEIAQKRTALENVLIPETLEAHRQRCKQAGFSSCDVWFQCLNFASLLALKAP